MARPIFHCEVCGAAVHEQEETCIGCGTPYGTDPASGKRVVTRTARLLPAWFPTGLIVVLAVYFGGVYGYMWWEENNSPERKAALELARVEKGIAPDDGLAAPEANLTEALRVYLWAQSQFPEDPWLQQRTEALRQRHGERQIPIPAELTRQVAFLAEAKKNRDSSRAPILVSGVRDRWDVDALMDAPARLMRWSMGGGALILLLYVWWRLAQRGPVKAGPPTKEELESPPHSRRH